MFKNLITTLIGGVTGGMGPLIPYLIAFTVGAGVGGFGTHTADSYYYGAQIQTGKIKLAEEKNAHISDMKAVSDKAAKAASDALIAQQNAQHRQAALEAQHYKEMNDAQAQNDSLRRDVAAGRSRLRIAIAANAAAAASRGSLPGNPGTGIVVDGSSAELDPTAQRSYFDLRDALTKTQAQIAGLQDYVKNICLQPK